MSLKVGNKGICSSNSKLVDHLRSSINDVTEYFERGGSKDFATKVQYIVRSTKNYDDWGRWSKTIKTN